MQVLDILVNNNNNVYLDNIKNIYTILPTVHELYLQTKPIVKYLKQKQKKKNLCPCFFNPKVT